jgi:hypothetical protein
MRVTCPAHVILLDMTTLVGSLEEYIQTMQFSLLYLHVPVFTRQSLLKPVFTHFQARGSAICWNTILRTSRKIADSITDKVIAFFQFT